MENLDTKSNIDFEAPSWELPEPVEDKRLTVLTFTLADQTMAVNVQHVREILDMTTIRQMPNAPHDVLGMIDLRGQAIAIIDLASRIGARVDNHESARIVVFEFGNDDDITSLGIVADKVLRVREIEPEDIEPVPKTMSGWESRETRGILRGDDGIAMVLNIDEILVEQNSTGPFDFSG